MSARITQLPCCTASRIRKPNCIHSLTLFRFVSRCCLLPENTAESAHTASWHRCVIVAGVWSDRCLGWRNAHWSGSCILPQNFWQADVTTVTVTLLRFINDMQTKNTNDRVFGCRAIVYYLLHIHESPMTATCLLHARACSFKLKPQMNNSKPKSIPSKAPLQFNAALALSALVNSTNAMRVG